MSENIDFSQYLRKQKDTKSSDTVDFSQYQRKESSKLKKAGRVVGQVALAAGERALFPYELSVEGMYSPETKTLERRQDIFEDIANLGTKKRKGTITPEEEQELKTLTEETKNPQETLKQFKPEKLGLRGTVEKSTGIDTTPQGFLENAAEWYGYLKDPKKSINSLKDWKNIRNLSKKELLKKFTPSAEEISAIGAGLGSEGGELGKIAGGTSALALANIVANIKKGKLMPRSKELQELHRIGRELGLSDKELTPIVQSRFKRDILGQVARPSNRAQRAIETSKSALGDIYDSVRNGPNSQKQPKRDQLGKFLESIEGIEQELKKSKIKGGDKKSLINELNDLINDVSANGITPQEIVETWQEMNRGVNWGKISEGDKLRHKIKEPLQNLLREIDPKGAKKFSDGNKLWENLQKTAKKLRKTDLSKLATKGEIFAGAKGLIDLASHGSTGILSTIITTHAARTLATEMLINPKLNNLLNKTLVGISSTKPHHRKAAMQKLVNYLKEDEKFKDEEEWDKLLQ